MNITKDELIEMICEGVNKKIVSIIEGEDKAIKLTENKIQNYVKEALLEYYISDNSVFGSDNFDYDDEYPAIDDETMRDILQEYEWEITDLHVVTSPSGLKAVRYEITYNKTPKNINQLYNDVKERATTPEGIRIKRIPNGYAIFAYFYNN